MKRFTPIKAAVSDVYVSEPLDYAVRCAASGDHRTMARVARVLRPRLIAEAMRRLGPSAQLADAEDIVQEVFLTMLEGKVFPPHAGQDAVTWLVRLVAAFVPSR
jgi:DNA-directed RNA polymerase specialized sigma24 family protein